MPSMTSMMSFMGPRDTRKLIMKSSTFTHDCIPGERLIAAAIYISITTPMHGRTPSINSTRSWLESGKPISEHQEAYDTFFVVRTTPKRGIKVTFNTEPVSQYISRYTGFQALLTNGIKDPLEALRVYRNKDQVEKCFDDLKNQLDMKRLRMHSSEAVDGRLFVQFIALIYMSSLRREMRKSCLIEQYTVRELLQEVTKPQRQILRELDIALPDNV